MSEGNRSERITKFFTWTVQFSVAKCWVEDGFELTDERALDMLAKDLGWAHGSELKAKVILPLKSFKKAAND